MVQRIAGLGDGGLAGKFRHKAGIRSGIIHKLNDIVGQDMLQKKVERLAVVLMAQMTEFVKEDIVLKHGGKADDVKVQVDVAFRRAASPIRCVVLDGHTVIYEAIAQGKLSKPRRKH